MSKPILLCLAALLLAGCCGSTPHQGAAVRQVVDLPVAFETVPAQPSDAEQLRMVSRNCLYGAPAPAKGRHGRLVTVYREGYVLLNESEAKDPLYVCERVTRDDTNEPLLLWGSTKPRIDPALGSHHEKATPEEYRGNREFDAAPMAPPDDAGRDRRRRDETSYLSNCAPMNHRTHHGAWATLEQAVRDWARRHGEAYVVSGPLFLAPGASDGTPLAVRTVGPLAVAVPTSFYKVVAYRNGPGTAWRAVAFVVPNQNPTTGMELHRYVRTIGWVESHAGIRFFPLMAGDDRAHLEDDAAFVESLRGARAEAPPACGGRSLAVGESVSVRVCARADRVDTRVDLSRDATYRFTTAATARWTDWVVGCGPNGYTSPLLFYAAWLRAAAERPWFELDGALDAGRNVRFPIGYGRESFTPPADGRLFCFANDVDFMRFNNAGAVDLTITRLR